MNKTMSAEARLPNPRMVTDISVTGCSILLGVGAFALIMLGVVLGMDTIESYIERYQHR